MTQSEERSYVFNEDIIVLNLEAENWPQALNTISKKLLEAEIVEETFNDAIIEREKKFATGLQGNTYGIAIPHTDAEHVKQQSISVAVLKEPVEFIHIGTDDQPVKVDIIFTLAIKDPDNQLEMLQKLMELIQDDEVLSEIKQSQDKQTILEIVETRLLQ